MAGDSSGSSGENGPASSTATSTAASPAATRLQTHRKNRSKDSTGLTMKSTLNPNAGGFQPSALGPIVRRFPLLEAIPR